MKKFTITIFITTILANAGSVAAIQDSGMTISKREILSFMIDADTHNNQTVRSTQAARCTVYGGASACEHTQIIAVHSHRH